MQKIFEDLARQGESEEYLARARDVEFAKQLMVLKYLNSFSR
jgi:hypothetical protein